MNNINYISYDYVCYSQQLFAKLNSPVLAAHKNKVITRKENIRPRRSANKAQSQKKSISVKTTDWPLVLKLLLTRKDKKPIIMPNKDTKTAAKLNWDKFTKKS